MVSRLRRRWIGFALIGLGTIAAAFAISYLIYAQVARERLDRLESFVPEQVRTGWLQPPTPTPSSISGSQAKRPVASSTAVTGFSVAAGTMTGTVTGTSVGAQNQPIVSPTSDPTNSNRGAFHPVDALYPAAMTNPKYWDSPLWSGSGPYGGPGLPEGFDFVSSFNAGRPVGTLEVARKIVIPAIGVDSEVRDLAILDLGDSRAYETPAHVVGHIPGTANPGENGNGWYFGHLESPFLGEGNVFYRLPELAQLIKEDPVDIIVEGDTTAFLYRVIATKVVHQDAISLFEAPVGTVTLVACVPSRVYDHRLLVTAQLIAERNQTVPDTGSGT
jgi:LPXTG-site transpeptidase (sortase) family protein